MKHFATVSYLRMMFQEFFESDCEGRFSKKNKTNKQKTDKQKSKQNEYFKNVNFIIFFFSQ